MDENNFSAPPVNMLNTNEDNHNSNAAPPELPSQEEVNTKDGKEEITTEDDKNEQNNNNNNNNNQEQEEEIEEIERPLIRHHHYEEEIGCARKTIQYIAIVALYIFAVWGIILQILYGGYFGIIDDVFCVLLASIMLFLTIKKRSTGGLKMGALTLLIFLLGAAARGVNTAFMSSNIITNIILLIVRSIFLMFMCTLNCNR